MSAQVQEALSAGIARLAQAGIDGAPRDARLLMAAALGVDPGRVTLALRDAITPPQRAAFDDHITRRIARAPVSHIIGHRDFYGRRFRVTPDVLDPRPETETLVAEALSAPFRDVLDLGTGSGAIALSLLAERPGARGVAADLSAAALDVARANAEALGVADRCAFLSSDWFDAVQGQFDLIISNPPYIALAEMPGLAPELAHEPRMALTDEGDGVQAYRRITAGAMQHLRPGGRLMVEIGWRQGGDVAGLFARAGLAQIRVLPDLNGHDRVVCGEKARV